MIDFARYAYAEQMQNSLFWTLELLAIFSLAWWPISKTFK